MRTINVAETIGKDLAIREMNSYLILEVRRTAEPVLLDFSDVETASRSFMDEFYHIFVSGEDPMASKASTKGMNDLLLHLLGAVTRTQRISRMKQPAPPDCLYITRTAAEMNPVYDLFK